jgi:hypothetical protein
MLIVGRTLIPDDTKGGVRSFSFEYPSDFKLNSKFGGAEYYNDSLLITLDSAYASITVEIVNPDSHIHTNEVIDPFYIDTVTNITTITVFNIEGKQVEGSISGLLNSHFRRATFNYLGLVLNIRLDWTRNCTALDFDQYYGHLIQTFKFIN